VSDKDAVDLALLIWRCGIGAVMLAHGINHVFGGGKIAGTARWFGSMGMKNPMMQAWMASITEVGSGSLLVLGLLTPFGAAGVVGVMAVAWIINHRGNGFFIFRPGEGWEYVMTLLFCGLVLGAVGPGTWSLDDAFDIRDDLTGTTGLAIAALAGGGGTLLLLAATWRPARKPAPAQPTAGD
jgi:putative oxidoreductase